MKEIKETDSRIFIGEIENGKLKGNGILILKSNGKAYNVIFDDDFVYRGSKIKLSKNGKELNKMIIAGNLKAPLITPRKEVLEKFYKENIKNNKSKRGLSNEDNEATAKKRKKSQSKQGKQGKQGNGF